MVVACRHRTFSREPRGADRYDGRVEPEEARSHQVDKQGTHLSVHARAQNGPHQILTFTLTASDNLVPVPADRLRSRVEESVGTPFEWSPGCRGHPTSEIARMAVLDGAQRKPRL